MADDLNNVPELTLEERRRQLLREITRYDASRLRITKEDLEEVGIVYDPDEHGRLYEPKP